MKLGAFSPLSDTMFAGANPPVAAPPAEGGGGWCWFSETDGRLLLRVRQRPQQPVRRERERVQLLTPWPGLCGVGWVRWLGEEPSRKEGEGGGASGFVRGLVPSFAACVRAVGEIQ
jgi:hypothetical protein